VVNFITTEEGNLICSFSGTLNSDVCLKMAGEISAKTSETKGKLIFDLKQVDYIASAFLRICQKSYKDTGAERFSIINLSPSVKKVFKVTGFEKFMNIQ
jgi:anti-anti-sigma factor